MGPFKIAGRREPVPFEGLAAAFRSCPECGRRLEVTVCAVAPGNPSRLRAESVLAVACGECGGTWDVSAHGRIRRLFGKNQEASIFAASFACRRGVGGAVVKVAEGAEEGPVTMEALLLGEAA